MRGETKVHEYQIVVKEILAEDEVTHSESKKNEPARSSERESTETDEGPKGWIPPASEGPF